MFTSDIELSREIKQNTKFGVFGGRVHLLFYDAVIEVRFFVGRFSDVRRNPFVSPYSK